MGVNSQNYNSKLSPTIAVGAHKVVEVPTIHLKIVMGKMVPLLFTRNKKMNAEETQPHSIRKPTWPQSEFRRVI